MQAVAFNRAPEDPPFGSCWRGIKEANALSNALAQCHYVHYILSLYWIRLSFRNLSRPGKFFTSLSTSAEGVSCSLQRSAAIVSFVAYSASFTVIVARFSVSVLRSALLDILNRPALAACFPLF